MQTIQRSLPFSMRFDPDMKRALQALADAENRSLTNYVETILREHITAKAEERTEKRAVRR